VLRDFREFVFYAFQELQTRYNTLYMELQTKVLSKLV
jgi:hypothetical protein